jgi:hypothetical protein
MATAGALGSPPNPPPLGGFGAPRCRSNCFPPSESAQGELHAHPTALGCPPLACSVLLGAVHEEARGGRLDARAPCSRQRCTAACPLVAEPLPSKFQRPPIRKERK